jgi:hypothetical protein
MNGTLLMNTSMDNEPTVCKIYSRELLAATTSKE